MSFSIWSFVIALIINGFIGYLALQHGKVDLGGFIAGSILGAGILAAGGFWFWMMLVFFFGSSTLFSAAGLRQKAGLSSIHAKGSVRDAWQVAANGGAAWAAALIYGFTRADAMACVFAAALAAAAADTWASEIGVLSRKAPVSIITGKPVERGISGGVSLVGTVAALAGSLSIAGLYVASQVFTRQGVTRQSLAIAGIITAAGFIAMLVDSLLGATIQVHYLDKETGKLTEQSSRGGKAFARARGFFCITNDMVNFLSTLSAALLAYGAYLVMN